MKITLRFKKEVTALVGGTMLAYLVVALCGINKTVFATTPSAFGGILLVLASRSFVASLVDKASEAKKGA